MTLSARSRLRAVGAALVATAAALSLTACAFAGTGSGDASPSTAPGALQTVTPGKLTIATGQPAFSPWVEDDDPASGKGFEAAVAYAVADKLGVAKDDVVWVRSTFESAIAPGAKDWDLNIQQFSITDERKQSVDFSSPYYTTTQAVVTTASSPAASVTSVADLAKYRVGVASSTTSYTVAAAKLGADKLSVYNSNDDVVAALKSGQIDALVVDLPTAFYLSGAVLDDGKVVGQFADSTEGGDQLAFVLPKGSALTAPVTAAVDALRADGTLADLEKQWLSDAVDAPVLK
ncbi:ABC transporter substrate-binding protein [uncultured Microbacterium sp.]|uniref:ABC transporter substrate-binding protein n=1 Tax=uncultured Microbacterium sp. TaxID=191216 RepID=UPI0025EF1C56|nr:ABC transporter substrate-binding protein [uncultured Microbacterium sp.]